MSKRPEINLSPEEYRPAFRGPLVKNPRQLLFWTIATAILSVFVAIGGWLIGTWWSALLPIPVAMYIGIGWAGLEPGFWFKEGRDDT